MNHKKGICYYYLGMYLSSYSMSSSGYSPTPLISPTIYGVRTNLSRERPDQNFLVPRIFGMDPIF